MIYKALQRETLSLVARAINTMLEAHGADYRVRADDIVITRRGGRVFIALTECRPDAQRVPPPRVNL